MRIVFLGTPDFAVASLNALAQKYEVIAVVCQPDRERDRKGRIIEGAVKKRAVELSIPVYQFEKIRRDGVETLKALAPDIMITCAYGQILSQEILDIAPLGILNVHGSLLPKYRGSAPIQRAIINGEEETGVTIMKTDIGMDSGAMLKKRAIKIENNDYVDTLYEKLSLVGAELLMETLPLYITGEITPVPQNEEEVTYAPMLKKEETLLDFTQSAKTIRNIVRGHGYGAFEYNGQQVKVHELDLAEGEGEPGEILVAKKRDFIVACKEGALNLKNLQMSGKKRMNTIDFLNGVKVTVGDKLTRIEK